MSTQPASPVFAWRNAVLADAALSPMGRLVALVLSVHMNGERGSCFPGIRLLMTQTALKRTAVYDHVSELKRAGWLGAEQQPGRGGPHGYVGTFPDDRSATPETSRPRTVHPRGTFRELSANRPVGRMPLSIEGDRARGRNDVRARRSGAMDLGKPTWLTTYMDQHTALTQGVPNAGVMARYLKPLHDEHGEGVVFARQAVYLKYLAGRDELQFLSYAKFAETFGQWVRPPAARRGARPTMNVGDKDFLA